MGATVCAAVAGDPDLELVAGVDPGAVGQEVEGITLAGEPEALLEAGAEVVVDFTVASAARGNVVWTGEHGLHAVVGTSGLSQDDLDSFAAAFTRSSCLVAPNFAIGAVLMMRFAELAAPWFETAEVIEIHHDAKRDAPSGTAMRTVQRMAAASKQWAPDPTEVEVSQGARGGADTSGIHVHSLRLRGVIANQEVILGTTGQTLTIRHDTYDRDSFMPGVLLAVKRAGELPGLTIGLDALLDL
jgi:4-hydroxy-tetrahydrodipicolinate reductase